MLDAAGFRAILPEFADSAKAPDAAVNFYLTLAYNSLNSDVWSSRLDAGAAFYAAHYLSLALPRASIVTAGGSFASAGAVAGIVTAKSVGNVSKSMDVSTGSTEGGGSFNATTYGRQYLDLLGTIGAGVMQF